jgi:hypothetical protein
MVFRSAIHAIGSTVIGWTPNNKPTIAATHGFPKTR